MFCGDFLYFLKIKKKKWSNSPKLYCGFKHHSASTTQIKIQNTNSIRVPGECWGNQTPPFFLPRCSPSSPHPPPPPPLSDQRGFCSAGCGGVTGMSCVRDCSSFYTLSALVSSFRGTGSTGCLLFKVVYLAGPRRTSHSLTLTDTHTTANTA